MTSENRSTVLIVDDREDVRAKLRVILEVTYRVLEASNSTDGLSYARAVLPDLIIGNDKLKGISGFDLCRRLKEDTATDFIPFILLTGEETPEVCRSCILSGADACLEQPIKAATLWLQVGNILARKFRVHTIL